MVINIKPNYQVAITYNTYGYSLNICFAEIADPEIANEIYELAQRHRGIEVVESVANLFATENISSVHKIDRLRSYYLLSIAPVFEVCHVARALAAVFSETHGLTVKLDVPPVDSNSKIEIFKPSKKD